MLTISTLFLAISTSFIFIGVHLVLTLLLVWVIIYFMRKKAKTSVHDLTWSVTPNFLFLLDKDCYVLDTNYYDRMNVPAPKEPMMFGDLLNCSNSSLNGGCGKSKDCGKCSIRNLISSSIEAKSNFKDIDVEMSLRSINRLEKSNFRLGGKYIRVNNKDLMLVVANDINNEKSLEKKTLHEIQKFSFLFENLPVGCAIFDAEGILTEMNDSYLEYMGVEDRGGLVGKLNIFDNPCVNESYKKLMRQGIPVSDEVKYEFSKLNKTYFTTRFRDDRYFRFIVNYLRDADGAVKSIVVLWVSNTLVHITLRKNKNFQKMVMYASSVSNVGFCSINLLGDDDIITYAFIRNLGEHGGGDIRYLLSHYGQVHPENRDELIAYQEKAMKQPVPSFEKDIRVLINGKYHWIKMHIGQQLFDPDNGTIQLSYVNIDITSQKETQNELLIEKEKAESSDKLKSAFLANMSHEIRTPLNAIVGFSELLAIAQDDAEKESYKDIIKKNNNLLLQLINDILDLSKIEANTLDFSYADFDVNELIREIVMTTTFRCQETKPNIEIQSAIPLDICVIHSEWIRLSQILNNFITNALKFTEQGHIKIGYETFKEGLRFFVEDTGIGIKEDRVDQVFDRFVKLNSNQQGTGLGLSICQSIVEKMGGEIGVNSTFGVGSTFWFYLPLSIATELNMANIVPNPSLKKSIPSAKEDEVVGEKKILIADEDESTFKICKALLKDEYTLLYAHDGEEAVSLFLKEQPSIVLMNVLLPKSDGYDSATAIRSIAPDVPLIALTVHAQLAEKRILKSGFNTYIEKPFTKEILFDTLRALTR